MINVVTTKGAFNNAVHEENEIQGKVIRKASLARQILRAGLDKGVRIIDLKGDKEDPDHKRSVYVFENSPAFQEVFSSVLEENRKNREDQEKSEAQKQIDELNKQVEELKKMLENKDKE